jgi:diguanylate cyclase (GGDEF)-like protein
MARHSGSARSPHRAKAVGLQARYRIALAVIVGAIAAFAVALGLPETVPIRLTRDLVLFNLAHLTAALLCWWPNVEPARNRRAWRLLAIAILLSTGGNACLTLIPEATLLPVPNSPTLSDVLYLAAYPVMNVAAVLLVRARGRHIVPAVWLDGLVIGLGAAAVVAALILAPLMRLGPPVSAHTVTDLAYPVADLTLLIVLATVGGITRLRLDRRLALLGLGLALTLVADLSYFLLNLTHTHREGSPLDVGWLLALLPIAAAACLPATDGRPEPETAPVERTAIIAPTVTALAALTVLMSAVLAGGDRPALPLAAIVLAGGCVLVALLRAALTLRQLQALPEAHRQARTDPLTDLANRRHLQEQCARALARPDAAPVSLLMIDLDGFKIVNDRHGHLVGDALLVEVAARLAATMRHDDLLGRLGGDEFAAILPRTTPAQACTVAQRMHAALATPIAVADRTFHVQASVGISAAGRPGVNTATLLQEADTAMYRAKKTRADTAVAARDWPLPHHHLHRDDLARRRA